MKRIEAALSPITSAIVRTDPERLTTFLSLLLALVFLGALLTEALWIRSAMLSAAKAQREIRTAQTLRSTELRRQLDEETGMRGYTSTGQRVFLQPYDAAVAELPKTFAQMRALLGSEGTGATAIALQNDQVFINTTWRRTVAAPLIAHSGGAGTLALQLRGKQLTDEFRADNDGLQLALSKTADEVDSRAESTVRRLIFWSTVLCGFLVVVFSGYAYIQEKLVQELRAQHRAYEYEKRIADELQDAFLQPTALPGSENIAFDAIYVPAGREMHVGGDWYDAFELPGGRILFSIGDVAGHGIEAAIVMSRARQAILATALQSTDAAEVLTQANSSLLLQGYTLVTALCGFIDVEATHLQYAVAGHPPALLATPDGSVQSLPHSGLPLGIVTDPEYRRFDLDMRGDALLALYTDGIVEFGRRILDGEAALRAAMGRVASEGAANPASRLLELVLGGSPPVDDVAILTIGFGAYARQRRATVRDRRRAQAASGLPAEEGGESSRLHVVRRLFV